MIHRTTAGRANSEPLRNWRREDATDSKTEQTNADRIKRLALLDVHLVAGRHGTGYNL